MEVIDISIVEDVLAVGTAGFVLGVVAPLAFRLIGYVVDSIRIVLLGGF